jgi:archaemetzincin
VRTNACHDERAAVAAVDPSECERAVMNPTIPIDVLVIVPFEGMPASVLEALADDLAARGPRVVTDSPVPMPQSAYAPSRGQYHAGALLDLVSGRGAPYVLGITRRDLFADRLNFVFGLASRLSGACVVSVARLTQGADDAIFRARMLKEAVHELGHTLGLGHCPDPACVMYFSNSLDDTDRKGDRYCDRCAALLAGGGGRRGRRSAG